MKSSPVEIPPVGPTKPGDDFYRACNSAWLRKTSLPAYRNTYSVSEELEDYLEGFLFQIARDATTVAKRGERLRGQVSKAEDAIGRLVLSAMRPEKQEKSVETLKHRLREIDCAKSTDDIALKLAELVLEGIPTILDVSVDYTYVKGGLRHILQIGPGTLGLSDPRYYLAGSAAIYSASILKEYKRLLQFVMGEFDLRTDLAAAISTEIDLAKPLLKAQDETELYNAPFREVRSKLSHVPWDTILKTLKLDGLIEGNTYVSILSLEWLSIVNSLFQSLPIESWRALLSVHIAVHGLQFLPPPFDQAHFALFGHTLLGQTKKIPQHILTMNVLRSSMSRYMSYFFIKRMLKPADKERATQFVESLMKAAVKRLQGTEWLERASKEKLVQKLRAMKLAIWYPEPVTPPGHIPELHTELFLENVYALNAANWLETIGLLHKQRETTWDEPVYSVNAYYYPDSNRMILPAGYFLWPFYRADRLGWSYGGLGTIIGHEIIHAFDEEGKEIDEKGRHETLWSKRDERNFEKRLSKVIKLYSQAKVGSVHVNGKETASENLADLGGIGIALDALEEVMRSRGISGPERIAELREFFWSYAVSWRTKVREKKALQDVFMDKHAPPSVRVNFVVAQIDAWYEAFGIQTADPMYVPPEERLRIF
jgi:putative endopeptidase